MIAVCKREFRALFSNLTGFLFLAVYFLILGIMVTVFNLTGNKIAAFHNQISNMALALGILIPFLTMRLFAQEKREGTEHLLRILPLRTADIVLGKYLACLSVLGIAALGTMLFPLFLSLFGNVNMKAAYLAILALFVMGAALLAIAVFFASLSKSYVCSALFAFLANLVLFLITVLGGNLLPAPFGDIANAAALFLRFDHFAMGLFDVGALIYALSLTAFFLVITVMRMHRRRQL